MSSYKITLITLNVYLVDLTNSNKLDEHGTESLSYVASLFFTNLTYWFFCL